jgi:hypothetical protein
LQPSLSKIHNDEVCSKNNKSVILLYHALSVSYSGNYPLILANQSINFFKTRFGLKAFNSTTRILAGSIVETISETSVERLKAPDITLCKLGYRRFQKKGGIINLPSSRLSGSLFNDTVTNYNFGK